MANEQISPKDRPAEPDHPMSLEGGFVDGDPAFMLQCLAEDFLQSGTEAGELAQMSRNRFYQALFAARQAVGDERADQILSNAVARAAGVRITVWESNAQDAPVDLTVSARTNVQREE